MVTICEHGFTSTPSRRHQDLVQYGSAMPQPKLKRLGQLWASFFTHQYYLPFPAQETTILPTHSLLLLRTWQSSQQVEVTSKDVHNIEGHGQQTTNAYEPRGNEAALASPRKWSSVDCSPHSPCNLSGNMMGRVSSYVVHRPFVPTKQVRPRRRHRPGAKASNATDDLAIFTSSISCVHVNPASHIGP